MEGERNVSGEYRYGYQGSEMDNELKDQRNSYTTHFRQLDVRIGRWLTIDPKANSLPHQSPYCTMDNNPVFYNDVNGDWVPKVAEETKASTNSDGEEVINKTNKLALVYEEGDTAESLAAYLDISLDEANNLFESECSLNPEGNYLIIPETVKGVSTINKMIDHYMKNPDEYGGCFDANYNCWNSCRAIAEEKMPETGGIIGSNLDLDTGKEFAVMLRDETQYENVSKEPDNIKFAQTVMRVAQNKFLGIDWSNRTVHGMVYLGTSVDGTTYVWTKNGWEDIPTIMTLDEVLEEYNGFLQGSGPTPNEGGYYNKK